MRLQAPDLRRVLGLALASQGAPTGPDPALDQLATDLAALLAAMQLEYGRVDPCDLVAHNPKRLPAVRVADVPLGDDPVRVDLWSLLGGKLATRGHVKNRGNGDLLLRFFDGDGVSHDGADYELGPGEVVDTSSFAYRICEVRAAVTAGRVLVFGQ